MPVAAEGNVALMMIVLAAAPSSRWRRLLARVGGWQAPPRNLLLSALVLLVFPWDDVLIDALYGRNPRLPTLVVYGLWSLCDFSVIWICWPAAASCGRRLCTEPSP